MLSKNSTQVSDWAARTQAPGPSAVFPHADTDSWVTGSAAGIWTTAPVRDAGTAAEHQLQADS